MTDRPRPLDGMRVLDLTQNVAGPLAAQVLADLGGDVLKVEAPEGEAARRLLASPPREDVQPYFLPYNRGKRSVVIDLRTPVGTERLLQLVETADVLIEGFRPGVMDRLGLGLDIVRQRNPRLVYCSLSAYGGSGPAGMRPGVDVVLQAESGVIAGLPGPDGRPVPVPFTFIDAATGHVVAQAVLAALLQRERHGTAEMVRVSLYDVSCSLQAVKLTEQLATGRVSDRAAMTTVPSGVFTTADGHVALAAYVDKHFRQLCDLLDRPDLGGDERFANQSARMHHRDELLTELSAVFAERSTADWIALLGGAGLMVGPVADYAEVAGSDVFAENELAVTVGSGDRVERSIRTPARYTGFSPAAVTPAPQLGEHTAEVLAELDAPRPVRVP